MNDCRRCGLTNLPFQPACDYCRSPLLDSETAAERRRSWDALPKQAQEEATLDIARGRERFDRHIEWLRKFRLRHSLIAGATFCLLLALVMRAVDSWIPLPIWFAIGAAAAWFLSLRRGGSFLGLGTFFAAYLIGVGVAIPFTVPEYFWRGWWLWAALFSAPVAGLGYWLGMRMDWESFERIFTA